MNLQVSALKPLNRSEVDDGENEQEFLIDLALLAVGHDVGNLIPQGDQALSEDLEALIIDPIPSPINFASENYLHITFIE